MMRFVCLLLCLYVNPLFSAVKFDDLTIIVSSCDKYKECWTPFCTLLHRYWPSLRAENSQVPVILIVNQAEFSHPGIQVMKTGRDVSWSDNLQAALGQVKTPYVLYLQEDYFFSKAVNEVGLWFYVDALAAPDIGYIQLTAEPYFKDSPAHPTFTNCVTKPRFMNYITSLQPALWRTDVLRLLLKPGESAWTFEIDGSRRSDGSLYKFLSVQRDYPLSFVNGCAAGFWSQPTLPFLAGEGLPVTQTSLPIDQDFPVSFWLRNHRPHLFKKWKKWMGLFYKEFRD